MKTTSVVGERGQITIPKTLRDRLGIHPGMRLRLSERNGKLIASLEGHADRLDQVTGILPPFDVDAYMRALRGPAWNRRMDPPSLAPRSRPLPRRQNERPARLRRNSR